MINCVINSIEGTELLSSGVNTTLSAASVSAEMLAKSATYAADTGMNAIGQSLTMSKNAAAKGAEFTYNAATMGKFFCCLFGSNTAKQYK